eukprot:CAMPEP_0194325520 /NCGR_PEP_ID=MMETSP0171-20130528/31167_1 /TAXON_ID=218684 /ORGANISM="Corethron pennatum, Strain L29A3" /LENGTH=158 /DNA_ID=CAMNT_0039084697 /DNA_START=296 /DNA_END=769 /DNA_ORIENTATION=-
MRVRNYLRSNEEHSLTLIHENNSDPNGKKVTTIIGHAFMTPKPSIGLKPSEAILSIDPMPMSPKQRTFTEDVWDKIYKDVVEKDPDLMCGYYCVGLVGIATSFRSQGIGEIMLKELLIRKDKKDGRLIRLYTQEPRIASALKNVGFQIIDECKINVTH